MVSWFGGLPDDSVRSGPLRTPRPADIPVPAAFLCHCGGMLRPNRLRSLLTCDVADYPTGLALHEAKN